MPVSDPGFVVGGRYANTAGEYTVMDIADGAVRIRYASGFEMSLPTQGLWAQWEAILDQRLGRTAAPAKEPAARATRAATATRSTTATRTAPARATATREPAAPKPKKGASGEAAFFTTVGYLAMGCDLICAVAGRDYPAMAQRYKIHTGRNLSTPHAGLDIHERPTHRMGAELSVRFPASAETLGFLDFGAGATVEPTDEPHQYTVNRNEFVERLLKLGLDLGPNTDPWPVREHVPDTHKVNFDRGITLRRGLRL